MTKALLTLFNIVPMGFYNIFLCHLLSAGDWAAVGATAALLANRSERGSSSEDQQIARNTSRISDLDGSRTNELDK